MKVYAISDTHFGHDKLVELSGRPENFSERILESLFPNTKALEPLRGDLLIHCGDFCIGNDGEWHRRFNTASCGFEKKILVRGNHDGKSDNWYYEHGWDFVCTSFVHTYFGKKIIFTHAPVQKTPAFDLNVHGHMHGNQHRHMEHQYDPSWHYDLAPELRDYKPVSLDALSQLTPKSTHP